MKSKTVTNINKKCRRLILMAALFVIIGTILLFTVNALLQGPVAHGGDRFIPKYEQVNLAPILMKQELAEDDYRLLYMQTGLGHAGVDELLKYGDKGKDYIGKIQQGFFAKQKVKCLSIFGPSFVCRDTIVDKKGKRISGVPLIPLEPADLLISFSTHTAGWRHGHAALVVDTENQRTLESIVIGMKSDLKYAWNWTSYSSFMVLRIKNADDRTREDVAEYALKNLKGLPYSLTSGIFGEKAPTQEDGLKIHCAYLPWYAWQEFGYDLDSDGGKAVTVADLAASPLLEVVQVYGIDPDTLNR